jgi:aryl-alcohol dehydrogenase-like predicted oxidoreductase
LELLHQQRGAWLRIPFGSWAAISRSIDSVLARCASLGKAFGVWPPDRDNALKVLRRAVELGVNLIDTADAYGPETSELLIAEALHPYPVGLVIATKGGLTRPGPAQWVPNGRPEYLKKCVDGSLKRLRLDRIDLYQLHRVDPKVPMEESLGALKEMQGTGKLRHVGLSEVTPEEITRARKVSTDRECAEPVQRREPQMGENANLLREGGPRLRGSCNDRP